MYFPTCILLLTYNDLIYFMEGPESKWLTQQKQITKQIKKFPQRTIPCNLCHFVKYVFLIGILVGLWIE